MGQEHLTVVTRKGQITGPAEIRRALGIKEGDKTALAIRETGSGEAVLRPMRSVAEATYGVVPPRRGELADLDHLRDQFEEGLETAEVAIRGAQLGAMLDGDRCEVRVGREVAGRAERREQVAPDGPVSWGGMH